MSYSFYLVYVYTSTSICVFVSASVSSIPTPILYLCLQMCIPVYVQFLNLCRKRTFLVKKSNTIQCHGRLEGHRTQQSQNGSLRSQMGRGSADNIIKNMNAAAFQEDVSSLVVLLRTSFPRPARLPVRPASLTFTCPIGPPKAFEFTSINSSCLPENRNNKSVPSPSHFPSTVALRRYYTGRQGAKKLVLPTLD